MGWPERPQWGGFLGKDSDVILTVSAIPIIVLGKLGFVIETVHRA